MTLITENGWPKIPANQLDRGLVPGTTQALEVRAGDVSVILKGFAAWYHRNVEPIDRYKPRDDWGWSATNDVWNSNHLSGTAIDINATQYPWKRLTMPKDRVAKVLQGIKLFEGTVFWGRGWRTVDEMHYQIQGNAQAIAPFANKLRSGYLGIYGKGVAIQPSPNGQVAPGGRPYLRQGATGDHVKDLQRQLKANYPLYAGHLAVDGQFGPQTAAAVMEFQRRYGHNLQVDGVVGPNTWRALGL